MWAWCSTFSVQGTGGTPLGSENSQGPWGWGDAGWVWGNPVETATATGSEQSLLWPPGLWQVSNISAVPSPQKPEPLPPVLPAVHGLEGCTLSGHSFREPPSSKLQCGPLTLRTFYPQTAPASHTTSWWSLAPLTTLQRAVYCSPSDCSSLAQPTNSSAICWDEPHLCQRDLNLLPSVSFP